MSVAGSVALAVAERVERTAGPRAGLVAWKALAQNSADAIVRGKALLAGLRCALVLRDVEALDVLTTQWETVSGGIWYDPITSLCTEMMRAKLSERAVALARAEASRHPTARALYCYARCLDIVRDQGAAGAFSEAIARSEKEGSKEIALASRVRRSSILSESWLTLGEAIDEASRVDLAQVPPASRLAVARVLLRSPSRFTRAAALGTLDDLVVSADPALAQRALAVVARWVDGSLAPLTPLELDRLLALFARERASKLAPRAREVVRAIDTISRAKDDAALVAALDEAGRVDPELVPLHARASDILGGRFEVPRESGGSPPSAPRERRAFRSAELLDVVVAMRVRAPARAARALRSLVDAERAGEPLPPQVFDVAHAALEYDNSELRDIAAAFIEARLRHASRGAPSRGFLALVETLAGLGLGDLANTARRAAVVAREPGASQSLGSFLAREGWDLAKRGEREKAIEKLREAKTLLESTR
jgi:hypothetical protein